MVTLLDQQVCQIERGPRGQPPTHFPAFGEAGFEELAGAALPSPVRRLLASLAGS